ncbi:3-deoxy-D-manno-octulosonic acid transferase [Rhodovulum adriaticum]|uniref:3-deoxy-D-manno-octulosonic acid transferase n=1 Tax=Rhodovulum adriaticum TaxID=35804 RepID=A0A4R2NYB7_RHOAD|nr:glycosyltransferase N-terminal domain-containing protein [Rhodovulum adriaticum]MBK1634237.1 hypothetical protein [Rhodovulum adriaticum]TCP27210.1 3-deoxy-D-manno-octulosonic-acid transferase [Rhodovulum adriaticum]
MQTATADRPSGPLIWVHAPPPKDRAATAQLLARLAEARPDLTVLLTEAGTAPPWAEGADLPALLYAAPPPDRQRAALGFCQHWRPDLALFFPATLPATPATQAHATGAALFLIARDIPRGWQRRWRIGTGLTRRLLRRFDRLYAQSAEIALALRAMGVPRWQIAACGPLDEGSAALPFAPAEREALALLLAGRPVWLAAGTRAPEDPVAVAAHAAIIRHMHRLLLILVPDDPARGPALAQRLRAEGWEVGLRSAGDEPTAETQIYLADTVGELGLWLRLAPVSFLGGTLGAGGGPDPCAAAALGSAILHGPMTETHAAHFERLTKARATRPVQDAASLAQGLGELLAPERAAHLARAAWDVTSAGTVATGRIVQRMLDTLDMAEAG